MTEIDVAEFNTRESAKFSLDSLNIARSRAHALLLVLLGGGGGLGALALAQLERHQHIIGVTALFASVWWFLLGAYVTLRALRSAAVRSWATQGLLNRYGEWQDYGKEASVTGQKVDAVAEIRKSAIRNAEIATSEYRTASTAANKAIDLAFMGMCATPVVAGIGSAIGQFLA